MKIQPYYATGILRDNGYSKDASVMISALLSKSIYDDIDLDDLALVPSRFAEYSSKKAAVADLGPDVKVACAAERGCVLIDLSQSPAAA